MYFEVYLAQAYVNLIKKHMFTPKEGICRYVIMFQSIMVFVLIEQRLVERMIIEKQCDTDTAAVVRCLYEQEVHQVSRRLFN